TLTSSAAKLREIMEGVLGWAKTSKFRTGDNPAAWAGHLENLLASPSKIRPTKHHPSMPYQEVPAFMAEIMKIETRASLALQFILLTAGRAREGADACWSEINDDNGIWTIPGARMKTHRPFEVPLSPAAVEVLERARKLFPSAKGNDLIFPGARHGRGIAKW